MVENARSYQALLRSNEELRATQSRLLAAERYVAIGELSAAVADGLGNPIAGIKAAAQLAKRDLPKKHPARVHITDIIGEADKLEGRIRALLDFAKPFDLQPAPCRIESIIVGALGSVRRHLLSQGIELITNFAASTPELEVDYTHTEQMVLALVSNAIAAMPAGGTLTVSTRALEGDRGVCFEIGDTGPGIPAENLPRIFELFFTTKASGMGLGLAVVKKIVDQHHGRISVESTVGKGSCFTVLLPVRSGVPLEEA